MNNIELARNLLTPIKTAELLGVTVGTLSVWRCTKRYPLNFIKIGKKVLYDANDIEKFIKTRTIEIVNAGEMSNG